MFQSSIHVEQNVSRGNGDTNFVKIPRLSNLDAEFQVFDDIRRFTELSEMLYKRRGSGNNAAPLLVLKELSKGLKMLNGEIQPLYLATLDAAFAYKRPKDVAVTSNDSSILVEDSLVRWRMWKSHLESFMKAHKNALLYVKQFQEKCWTTRDKVKTYANMLEAAKLSLPNYKDDGNEYNARCRAITHLIKDMKSRQMKHVHNLNQYIIMLKREHTVRQQIIQIASSLESEIKACWLKQMLQGLDFLVAASDLGQSSLNLDLGRMCDRLYDVVCKKYFFSMPPTDVSGPEFNIALVMPHMDKSSYSFCDLHTPYAAHSYVGAVVEDVKKVSDSHLSLKVGDKVKLKIVSSDQKLGFGWTRQSKLSFKKWCIFPLKNTEFCSVQTSGN